MRHTPAHAISIALAIALTVATTALLPGYSHAGPMGFKDSSMAMGDMSPNWQEVWINHAITSRDAFGAGVLGMRSDNGLLRRNFVEATYTRLAKRWNGEHSQANIWLLAGAGAVQGNDFAGTRTMLAPGISADYETTRFYVNTTARLYRAPGINHDFVSARVGFSFYEADYDETQPWFIVEARRMRGLSEKVEITPMLRLINKRYFIDVGLNNSNQARVNFMYIF
jgi:hypothetical protein